MFNPNLVRLSNREREIIACRARGLSYKEIAAELDIELSTVKTHMSRIFVKLHVQCSIEMLQHMPPSDCLHCPHRVAKPHK